MREALADAENNVLSFSAKIAYCLIPQDLVKNH
jgi:hypothetical protein